MKERRKRTNYSKGYVLFDDTVEGWGRARLFMDWVGKTDEAMKIAYQGSLEPANDYAEANPHKYKAWKAFMRLQHSDKFEGVPLHMLGEVGGQTET